MLSSDPPKPDWIKVRLGRGPGYNRLRGIVEAGGLHTVCKEALCPNRGHCWEHGRATLMILGSTCTRGCRFCNVAAGLPGAVDPHEPERVAAAVAAMGLRDVVLTSVTRDDLPDRGSEAWVRTLRAIRQHCPSVRVEVLIPDFSGCDEGLRRVLDERPDVLGHNLEMAPRLYAALRPASAYARSRFVLERAAAAGLTVKTGIMLGLGESDKECSALIGDAAAAGCRIFYAGQYLRPSRRHAPVRRYLTPERFQAIADEARAAGIPVAVAAPLVRSSTHADEQDSYLRARSRQPPSLANAAACGIMEPSLPGDSAS